MSTVIDQFRPYTVVDSDEAPETVLGRIHTQFFHGKGPDTTKGAKCDKGLAHDFSDFVELCSELASHPELQPVRACDFAQGHYDRSRVPLLLRHDVDGDIEAALKMAEVERSYGLLGTFYMLPAALYYSDYYYARSGNADRPYEAPAVRRYSRMAEYYRAIEAMGHEVGLHYFPYGTYREKLMDGVDSIIEEARWLRSVGLTVRGGVGHSSHFAQGADSVEIFREITDLSFPFQGIVDLRSRRGSVEFKAVSMPRHVMQLSDVPFDYVLELTPRGTGHYAICENCEVRCPIPGMRPYSADLQHVYLDISRQLAAGTLDLVTIMIHPEHMNARVSADRAQEAAVSTEAGAAPEVAIKGSSASLRQAGALNISSHTTSRGVERKSAVFVNSLGLLDYEPVASIEQERPLVAILGTELLDCPHLTLSRQMQGWMRKLSVFKGGRRIATRKYSTRGADVAFLEQAVSWQLQERTPEAWVLSFDGEIVREADGKQFEQLCRSLASTGKPIAVLLDDRRPADEADLKKGLAALTRLTERAIPIVTVSQVLADHRPVDTAELVPDGQHCLLMAERLLLELGMLPASDVTTSKKMNGAAI